MEERSEYCMDKVDDVMPGFRFHPTDEELVGFYLKRKIQQKSLPIELIKQVDIYKYEPWDLPKLASTGEKEWYFYCPRDRKYRNSARPNRVTRAGFWKATGTDRPIYSSEEGKCIGLKKSLVFYKGRAAKGTKTDWMMHEFRLPCVPDSAPPKKLSDKSFSARDSWAICRIFKKTNSQSMVQKALSHPWISQLPGSMVSDFFTQQGANYNNNQFCSENISDTTTTTTTTTQVAGSSAIHQVSNNANTNTNTNFINSSSNTVSNKPSQSQIPVLDGDLALVDNLIFYTAGPTNKFNSAVDASNSINMLSNNFDYLGFEEPNNNNYSGFSITSLPQDILQLQTNYNMGGTEIAGRTFGFPFSLPPNDATWDTFPCPSEMSTTYVSSKCYT